MFSTVQFQILKPSQPQKLDVSTVRNAKIIIRFCTYQGNMYKFQIGFSIYYLLDGGEVVGSIGVRVRDEHQGQGLMGWMCNQALRCVTQKYPTIRREAWCSQYLPYLQRELEKSGSTTTADREAVWDTDFITPPKRYILSAKGFTV